MTIKKAKAKEEKKVSSTLLAQAAAAAETGHDMHDVEAGPAAIEEGQYLARIVEYVEIGLRANKNSKFKSGPLPNCYVGFVIYIPDGEGGFQERFYRPPFPMDIKRNESSNFAKMVAGVDPKDMYKNLGQMLGTLVMVTFKKKGEYVNIDWQQVRLAIDPTTRKPYSNAPEVDPNMFRLFLWHAPTIEMWDSLYIEGEWERKDKDGNVTTVSKNVLQEAILAALDFQGSPAEALLISNGAEIPDPSEEEEAEEDAEEVEEEEEEIEEEEEEEAPPPPPKPKKAKGALPTIKRARAVTP